MIKDHSKFQIHPELARLLDRHEQATLNYDEAADRLNRASSELASATRDLCKWMTPADAKDGERFSVWLGAILFTVTLHKGRPSAGDDVPGIADSYSISLRKGGIVS